MSLIRFSLIYREGIGKKMVVFFEEYLFFYLRKEKKDVKKKNITVQKILLANIYLHSMRNN